MIFFLLTAGISILVSAITTVLIYYGAKRKRELNKYDLGRISGILEVCPALRSRIEAGGYMSDFEYWGLLEIESRFNRRES